MVVGWGEGGGKAGSWGAIGRLREHGYMQAGGGVTNSNWRRREGGGHACAKCAGRDEGEMMRSYFFPVNGL